MEISPDVLEFSAPFNEQSTKPLYLKNTSKSRQAYKIKTTAPKLYCVRPNASVIEPGQSVEVSIIRQGKEEPNPAAKTKDKFLVLTIPVEKVESDEDFPTLWAKFEKESEVLISRKKIRVQYEFGTNGTTHQPSDTSVENVGNESEANTSHTLEDHDTTILMSEPTSGIPSSPPAYENTRSGEPKVSVVEQPDVKEELQQAREKISTMSKELKTPSAKPSGINPLANIAPPTTAVRPSSGIPISLTLIIALIAFYIGWRFA